MLVRCGRGGVVGGANTVACDERLGRDASAGTLEHDLAVFIAVRATSRLESLTFVRPIPLRNRRSHKSLPNALLRSLHLRTRPVEEGRLTVLL